MKADHFFEFVVRASSWVGTAAFYDSLWRPKMSLVEGGLEQPAVLRLCLCDSRFPLLGCVGFLSSCFTAVGRAVARVGSPASGDALGRPPVVRYFPRFAL